MTRSVYLSLVLLVCASASATTVTGTLQDPAGQLLANASIRIDFAPRNPSEPNNPVIQPVNVTTNNAGFFSTTLTSNATITPINSTYTFTICPNASVPCSIVKGVSVSGTSQDVSAFLNTGITQINVTASNLLPKAYTDAEINTTDLANTGALYWNTIDRTLHTWDGTVWLTTSPTTSIVSSSSPGADMCAKIVNRANSLSAAGTKGAVIDAQSFHGVQACANALNGWPWTPGANPLFAAYILVAPDVIIQSAVRFQIPTHTIIDGSTSHGNYFGTTNYTGAWIAPAAGYTDNVMVELGANNVSGGTPPQGARLRNIGVTCQNAAGNSALTNGIGIINQYAQERSGWTGVHISGCTTGFDIESAGILGGPINGGPYQDTHITMENANDIGTGGACFKIGTNSTGVTQVGVIENLWCSCTNAAAACGYMGYIDGHVIRFKGETKLEQGQNGILAGSVHNTQDVKFDDLVTVSTATRQIGIVLQFTGTNREIQANIFAIGTNYITNSIVGDASPNGKTITVASQGGGPNDISFWYYRTGDDKVQTSAKGVPSQLFTLTDLALSASTSLNTTTHCVNISAGCTSDCTMTLPATINTNGCDYRIINSQASVASPVIITVARNGNNINGLGQDLKLAYGESVHIYANSAATTWRAETFQAIQNPQDITPSATPVLCAWCKVQRLQLSQNVTSSTWPAGKDGQCSVLRLSPVTFTWVWPVGPPGVSGQMTVQANKVNQQQFCYSTISGKWEATDVGTSF